MYNLSQSVLQRISDTLQVGKNSPNYQLVVWKGDKKNSFQNFPYIFSNVKSISIERRWNMASDELEVEMSNINGYYSPDYSNKKEYTNVPELPVSSYKDVIKAYNKVTCEVGYGDETIRIFTGQIQNVNIAEKDSSISFNALNVYRKLLKPIDPIHKRVLVYENARAFDIIKDLCKKAGIENEWIIYDDETINGNDFTINKAQFNLGISYSDAIKQILEMMNHRIVGDRNGNINIFKNEVFTQKSYHNWVFDDFINLTDGNYEINTSSIRNRIIVMSNNGWQAFEDKFLVDYCNGEIISFGVECEWAETIEQKWAVADNYFIQMRRKLRRISVAVIGNPCMDVGDLVKMSLLTSTASEKYMIVAIQSSFSTSGYIDQVDLEYIGKMDGGHLCELADGEYEPEEEEKEQEEEEKKEVEVYNVVVTKRDLIVAEAKKYLGIYYQWAGNYIVEREKYYGVDCSHFTYGILQKFGLVKSYARAVDQYPIYCTPISIDKLKPADLVFYGRSLTDIYHVVMYIGNNKIIGANGGDDDVTNSEIAQQRRAMINIKPMNEMGKPLCCGRVKGLE